MSSSYIPDELRRRVAKQGRYRCGYCLSAEKIIGMKMTIDHLMPESGTDILGKTRTGRVTVNALQLNRKPLVEGRRSWVTVGWHPPDE